LPIFRINNVIIPHRLFTFLFYYALKQLLLTARQPSQFCPSVRLSVTWVDQSKTVQARITKFSPPAAFKTLVSKTVKLFHKFKGGHLERGR